MPRPEQKMVTFSIDGREVSAPENVMLVDGAKYGDVEIPVFCYEPKLGAPVGACRMCLVEIEGIPKLQTACSTPVKDGMVVHTQTERVQTAQRAVVEFLLINHPLDCPVCDKGGECPLQDITYGWGPGTSRFIEPKRHFRKPLELSPLIAIDRERCILCYRCVRFSQEVSEDYQLVLQERGAHAFVSTFDGTPYVAPFSGNITDLCPVGALTPTSYRFRARPWDIEGAGTVCTLCPSQCNVTLTVRDDRVMRVLARDNEDVDDGWLCDKGRFAFQYTHVDERITQPMVREGQSLKPASWEKALDAAASALRKAGARAAALADGETTNEEAFLLARLFRETLGSSRLASSPTDALPDDVALALGAPGLQATVADLEYAHSILLLDVDPVDEATIWDLRIRKGVRRHGARLAVASARPTALDPNAAAVVRHAPGSLEGLLVALDAALSGDEGNLGGAATAAGTKAALIRDLAALLRDTGEDVVIVASERTLTGGAGRALLNVAARLGLAGRAGAGLLIAPASANGRGIREAGFTGGSAPAIARGLAGGDLSVLYLLHADPIRQHPDREAWEAALGAAQTVIAHESLMTETVRRFADVVFPAEAYPEKEGTVVHPDGRIQRLRPAIGRPAQEPGVPGSGVRGTWHVIAEVAQRAGHPGRVLAGAMASKQLFEAVPFYRGLTLDEIGGKGVRWPERDAAAAYEAPAWEPVRLEVPAAAPGARDAELRLGTYRTLWASKEVDVSPHLQFAVQKQAIELSAADAERLGIANGAEVEVRSNGHRVTGAAIVRAAVPAGSVFVASGTTEASGNVLTAPVVSVRALGGYVEDMPVPPAAAGQLAEDAAGVPAGEAGGEAQTGTRGGAAGPGEGSMGTTSGGGEDPLDRHAAEDRGADQTADAPDAGGDSSGSREATGGSATGEGEGTGP
ncbi:MAG TPA: NADH-quinone oxidoreductase subunit NuoG [Solirubrobacteraceae bacterium]|nr:NADH-quinone oxidoreductase subunit NuoG [Solirubrobacteraceae bacterium]